MGVYVGGGGGGDEHKEDPVEIFKEAYCVGHV